MKKGNIIELLPRQDPCPANTMDRETSMSEELKAAIQHLIHRLREGPLASSN